MGDVLLIDSDRAAQGWLARLRTVYFSKATPLVEIDLPHLTEADNRSLTREANRLRNACGCSQAGLAMTATLLALAYWFATDGVPLAGVAWSSWGLAVLAVAGAAGVAKVVALMVAHRRLIALAEQIGLPGHGSQELTAVKL